MEIYYLQLQGEVEDIAALHSSMRCMELYYLQLQDEMSTCCLTGEGHQGALPSWLHNERAGADWVGRGTCLQQLSGWHELKTAW